MVMAERRKNKKKKETEVKDVDKKPSKEEYNVAKYLKAKLPEKKTTLLGHKVEYFIACKAVDCLIESPWAKEHKKGELNFSNRDIAIDFMAKLLDHKFFHRAKKIVVTKEPKKKKKETEEPAPEPIKEKESKKPKSKSDATEKTDDKDAKKAKSEDKETKKGKSDEKDGKKAKSDEKDGKKAKSDEKKSGGKEVKKETSEVPEKKKEKKKIKLDMHLDQCFIDSNEPYVWIYDPIPLKTWITGTLMVIAAVLLCLFPLWPQTIRHYIYYLSVAAAFFLIFIIGLAVLRLVVFVILWVVTLGKHHLWLLPNLTEDVGFFESFWPLYKYEYKGTPTADTKKKGKKGKDKKDDGEKEGDSANDETRDQSDSDSKKEGEEPREKGEESESGEERTDSEQRRSDEEDDEEEPKTENGFEFLEAEEASEEEEEDRKTK